jgi:hypothetical protein
MTLFTVGDSGACVDQATYGGDTYTHVSRAASDGTGDIDSICIFVNTAYATGMQLASFSASGNDLTTNETSDAAEAISAGQQTITAPGDFTAFGINTGEYLGIKANTTGKPDITVSGGSGWWYYNGDAIPCTGTTFSTDADATLAITASGTAAAGDLSINISNGMTIAESIVGAMPLPGISISDSIAIAEAITPDIPLAVAITDSIAIAESIGESVPLPGLSVADSITIADVITALKDLQDISLSDSITIAEAITAALSGLVLLPSVIDAVTIAEAITLNLPPGVASVADSVVITETIQGMLDLLSTVTDSITISDVVTAALSGVAVAGRVKRGLLLGVYP